MKKIPLTQGKFALVDDADFEWLNQWKWYFGDTGYAVRQVHVGFRDGKQIQHKVRMHRLIMSPSEDMYVDHVNSDKLDNQRFNLRVATNQQNQGNSRIQVNNTSGYKGVYSTGWGKWRARLHIMKKGINGGSYDTKEEAALAYNRLAIKHFGEFAQLNEVN